MRQSRESKQTHTLRQKMLRRRCGSLLMMAAATPRLLLHSTTTAPPPAAAGSSTTKDLASTDYHHYRKKLSPAIGRGHHVFLDKGEGSWVYDIAGRKFLDFSSGIGVTNLGHANPRLVKVAQQQLERLWHAQCSTGVHTAMADLIDEMETVMPKHLTSYFFSTTGAEAVEASMRAARNATGRQKVVAMQGSYHGRTFGTLSLTSSKYAYGHGTGPWMPGVLFAPVPYPSQLKTKVTKSPQKLIDKSIALLRDQLMQVTSPADVAMIIAEPVLGEGGYFPLPKAYLQGLRTICDEHGILLVLDEVQTGFGRTGTMWSIEQTATSSEADDAVKPDILVFAKGIANGLPLSGIATTASVAEKSFVGTHGGTYAGNAVSCAVAAEVVRMLKETKTPNASFGDAGILRNVNVRSAQLMSGLRRASIEEGLPVWEVRGRGLMVGVQFVSDIEGIEHRAGTVVVPKGFASKVVNECTDRGMLLMSCSIFETIRFIPPLTVNEHEVDLAIQIFTDAVKKVAAECGLAGIPGMTAAPCCENSCLSAGPNESAAGCGGSSCRYILTQPPNSNK